MLLALLRRYDIDSLENRDEALIARLHRLFHGPLMTYFRAQVRGLERIPSGPALLVGNHSGGLMPVDAIVFGSELYRVRGIADAPYGLAHELAIRLPGIHPLIMRLGAVRASHENGLRLLERGHKVLVYPGGDVDSMRPFRHRNRVVFDGRTGFVRLALQARVPIVPVVCAGGHGTWVVLSDLRGLARRLRLAESPLRAHAWPLALSLPWGLTLFPPPLFVPLPSRFLFEVLEPITFPGLDAAAAADRATLGACAEQVRGTMQAALERLAAER
jgi:1-acyl-sn-glycerol-3-phosphate acyltransferase